MNIMFDFHHYQEIAKRTFSTNVDVFFECFHQKDPKARVDIIRCIAWKKNFKMAVVTNTDRLP